MKTKKTGKKETGKKTTKETGSVLDRMTVRQLIEIIGARAILPFVK